MTATDAPSLLRVFQNKKLLAVQWVLLANMACACFSFVWLDKLQTPDAKGAKASLLLFQEACFFETLMALFVNTYIDYRHFCYFCLVFLTSLRLFSKRV